FQAIIIWRDELNEGKVFLRDIIDLEATYAGPDAKAMPAAVVVPGVPGSPGAEVGANPGMHAQGAVASAIPAAVAPATAPAAATPFKAKFEMNGGEEGEGATPPGESDLDEDDMENSLSLAAIEAELKPKV